MQAILYENAGLQNEIWARHHQVERCESTITHLTKFYVDHSRDQGQHHHYCTEVYNFYHQKVS